MEEDAVKTNMAKADLAKMGCEAQANKRAAATTQLEQARAAQLELARAAKAEREAAAKAEAERVAAAGGGGAGGLSGPHAPWDRSTRVAAPALGVAAPALGVAAPALGVKRASAWALCQQGIAGLE